MYSCERCTDLMLEDLYGLLEAEESVLLRAHLAQCPSCQEVLRQAQSQQGLFAQAAQVVTDVPAFSAPSETSVSIQPVAKQLPPSPATLPLTPRRPLRRWAWLSAAAVLLLTVLGGGVRYQHVLNVRQDALDRARAAVTTLDTKAVRQTKATESRLAELQAQEKDRGLQVKAVGPVSVQNNDIATVHVTTKNLWGELTPTEVAVELYDQTTNSVLRRKVIECKGDDLVSLSVGNSLVAGNQTFLSVTATNYLGAQNVRQVLPVVEPELATHLVTNKSAFHVGEVLFFRSLTLERFSLRPAEQDLSLVYQLRDAGGRPLKQLAATTSHGIGHGEFAVTPNLPSGEYQLEVIAQNPPQNAKFLPASRKLVIYRDEPAQLLFHRPAYQPGDKVNAVYQGRRDLTGPAADQPITVKANADKQPLSVNGSLPGQPVQLRTDALGRANLDLNLPSKLSKSDAAIEVEIHGDKQSERFTQQIPVIPPGVQVEFFPEGGDLIAGYKQRVYFRARNLLGEPIDIEGSVLDSSGKETVRATTSGLTAETGRPMGLGEFPLTPKLGESYRFRVQRPQGPEQRLPLPAVQRSGVALTVPKGVTREGEPLKVIVKDTQVKRPLVVLAVCRGRVVDQMFVTDPQGQVALHPKVGGVVRVTVYEQRQEELVPLAERLVYRAPAQFLSFDIQDAASNGKLEQPAGKRVNWTVNSWSEEKKPASGWMMAAVVDERALGMVGSTTQHSLPAHFYLTNDVRDPEALEQADILLADRPESHRALDLFLGAHGWRRFASTNLDRQLALKKGTPEKSQQPPLDTTGMVVFANSLQAGKEQAAQSTAKELASVMFAATEERETMAKEREQLLQEVSHAGETLQWQRDLPSLVLRASSGLLLLALLLAGLLLLLFGLIRALLFGRSPRLALLGSCVAFGLFCGLYILGNSLLGPASENRVQPNAEFTKFHWPALPGAPGGSAVVLATEKKMDELFSYRRLATAEDAFAAKSATEPAFNAYAAQQDLQAKAENVMTTYFLRQEVASTLSKNADGSLPLARSQQLIDRYNSAAAVEKAQLGKNGYFGGYGTGGLGAGGGGAASTGVAAGGASGGGFKGSKGNVPPAEAKGGNSGLLTPGKGGMTVSAPVKDKTLLLSESRETLREYAYKLPEAGKDYQDTVLWHPALAAPNGVANISFDLPMAPTTYRVWIFGHTEDGRLGVFQGRLEAK